MPALIRDATLLDPEADEAMAGSLVVDGDRIVDRFPEGSKAPDGLDPHPLSGRRIAPGLIDLHFHGELIYAGADQVDAALRRTSRTLSESGVTSFLATTVAWGHERADSFMTQVEQSMTQGEWPGACPLGVHLEGPWISHEAAGAQPRSAIRPFGSAEDRQLLDIYHEIIKMVTFAPECEGAGALLEELTQRSMVASLGHIRAPGKAIDAARV